MVVKEVRPGFEKEAELLLQKKEALESEKQMAIEEAVNAVNREFAEREDTIISILKLITVEVEVEEEITAEPEAEVTEVSLDVEVPEDESVEETPAVGQTPGQARPLSPGQVRFN